ncbi:MBL fold metallo-hydrolase [Pelagicoccus sp. SDUM812003]|uniref:MBL fold metallo-hydrolase n=1 Tax=Pelagicoccus sp. SDUM812003 TaxID=3041267 RepID=UPI00280F54D6|nr:MBL fold metallo-hydrolase [Pelagicoccus sp. SDUM812003]MDQ8202852.1 MBL fold metallo-hydrolase [Pelagicoccus sp. SDUM812003]
MPSTTTRRDVLKSLALASLAIGIASPSKAALGKGKKALTQGAGFYKKRIGAIELYVIADGSIPLDSNVFGSGKASREEIEAALAATYQPTDVVPTHVQTFVIKTGDQTILVDTGLNGAWGPESGLLTQHLANAGFRTEDITDLVLTHAHPDHLFGALDKAGKPVFKKAAHHITQAELDQWYGLYEQIDSIEQEGFADMVRGIHQHLEAIKPKLNVIEPDAVIAPGVTGIPLPGHTQGHIGLKLESEGQQHWFLADFAHNHELFLAHPDWGIDYDTDGEQAIATRQKRLAMAAEQGVEVSGSHMPFPAVGHIAKAGEGYRWVPELWRWS